MIWLAREIECVVSDDDMPMLSDFSWHPQADRQSNRVYVYAKVTVRLESGVTVRRKVYIHRLITGAPNGWMVDHRDRNTLHNWRDNLRITVGTYNNANARREPGESGYRGVRRTGKVSWCARIECFGQEIYLGTFHNPVEAACTYDRKALELFGEFAWLNFDERSLVPVVEPADEIPF